MSDKCKQCPLLVKGKTDDVITNLVEIADCMFDLFKMQPTTTDWPVECQKIVAHLQIQFESYKAELNKALTKLS